jgi:ferredoxin like protein
MNITDKLYRVRFNVDRGNSHIRIDKEACSRCDNRVCLYVCPAEVYAITEEGEITASYQGCLECGTCRIACAGGGIEWTYPKGGFGVCFRYG